MEMKGGLESTTYTIPWLDSPARFQEETVLCFDRWDMG